jgi:hypothetical protein
MIPFHDQIKKQVFILGFITSVIGSLAMHSTGLDRADKMINANTDNHVDLTDLMKLLMCFGVVISLASVAGCVGMVRGGI